MKNGYTPKQFAYSVVVDALYERMKGIQLGHYDEELTPSNQKQTLEQMRKLREQLANKAKLDLVIT